MSDLLEAGHSEFKMYNNDMRKTFETIIYIGLTIVGILFIITGDIIKGTLCLIYAEVLIGIHYK